jgi:hypothetical protein
MAMKRYVRLFLMSVAVLIVILVLSFFGLVYVYATSYWWDRDNWNQERIAKAYISFCKDNNNFPKSLADLVKTGYLPEKADWYKEPPGLFPRAVDFNESCYVVMAPESGDIDKLKMIGRRVQPGKEELDFSPPINAELRDGLRTIGK